MTNHAQGIAAEAKLLVLRLIEQDNKEGCDQVLWFLQWGMWVKAFMVLHLGDYTRHVNSSGSEKGLKTTLIKVLAMLLTLCP